MNSQVRQTWFTNRAVNFWNSLLLYSVVNAPSIVTFKTKLDEHLKKIVFIDEYNKPQTLLCLKRLEPLQVIYLILQYK